ncbi:HAD family hydrolase [Roseibium sp.]|uniref:HAD family hydrolase n=1 Tax=Roseibium sp. TaxID=1936156 RepID=UPI003B52C5EE
MIMFDFDGVISDSKEVCLEACRAAAREQDERVAIADDAFSDLDPLTFEALAIRHDLKPDAFAASVANHVSQRADLCQPFGGIPEMIAEISGQHELAVMSASHSRVIRSFLVRHGLIEKFLHVIGGDTPGNKAEKIANLKKTAGGSSHAFVGDAVSDMQAAQACELPVIAVTWGWQPRGRLEAENPDHIVTSPQELSEVIRGISVSTEGASL